jgi:hypothetical protein
VLHMARRNFGLGRDSSSLPDLVFSFAIVLQLDSSAAHGLVLHFSEVQFTLLRGVHLS